MGFIDRLLPGNSKQRNGHNQGKVRNTSEYDPVTRLDASSDKTSNADKKVQCIEINQNTDIIQTKDELRNGNIVLADITGLGTGLSEDRVLNDLQQAVEDVDGDIAMQNTDTHVILTPNNIEVSRNVL